MSSIFRPIALTYPKSSLIAMGIFLTIFLVFGVVSLATMNTASDHMKESHLSYGCISLGIVAISIITLWLVARKHAKSTV